VACGHHPASHVSGQRRATADLSCQPAGARVDPPLQLAPGGAG